MFHYRTRAWDGDEREMRRGEERRGDGLNDEDGGSTLMHCIIQC